MMVEQVADEVEVRELDVVAREQLHGVLMDCTPDVIAALRAALDEGRVDGSLYWDGTRGCGCVLGTLVHARGVEDVSGTAMEYRSATTYALEDWAHRIHSGDLPDLLANEDSAAFAAACLMQWIDEFEAERVSA